MWQVTYLFLFRALVDLVERIPSGGYSGVLNTTWLGLYQPPTVAINANSTMANITEATYHGYARQPVVWFQPIQSSAGVEAVYGVNLFFQPIDTVVPNTITGVFLADAAYGGNLLMAQQLPAPGVAFPGPQAGMSVKPAFSMGVGQIYGGGEVES